MFVEKLEIVDFRNIQHASLVFDPNLNLIFGDNASGKTSLLEALFFLGRGKSFRVMRGKQLVRDQADRMRVVGHIKKQDETIVVGIERKANNHTLIRVRGETINNLTALVQTLPVQIFSTSTDRLITDGPGVRRKFLDWILFHVEHEFLSTWRKYIKGVKQRNAALKQSPNRKMILAFGHDISESGTRYHDMRTRLVDEFQQELQVYLKRIDFPLPIECSYFPGFQSEIMNLNRAFEENLERDFARKTTSVGPHRADLVLTTNGTSVADVLSRGQTKLLSLCLVLTQIQLMKSKLGWTPILMVDDLKAELDRRNFSCAIDLLDETGAQLVFTSIEDLPEDKRFSKRFHVEHGTIELVL